MKKELKISTLSIVCVLCTTIAMPSFGASAVRSLGGAGTYSSASSAASTGTKSASAAKNTVRAGSMRVNNAKSATTAGAASTGATSTRAATTPRLSIGKYLASSSAIGAGSGGVIKPGQSGNHGVEGRVTALENALGLGEYDGEFGDLVIDVEQMQKDLEALTGDDFVVEADYSNGVLTITQGDREIFSEEIATESGLKELQDKLDELSETFATKTDLEAAEDNLSKVQTAVAELEAVVESLDKVGSLEFEQQVAALKAVDDELTLAINGIKEIDHSKYATTEALDALSTELKDLISKAAGGEDLAGLSDEISRLSSTLSTLSDQALLNQNAIKANEERIAALQEADKGFATTDALTAMQIALLEAINEKQAAGDYLVAADLTELSDAVAALETGKADASTVSSIQETIGKLGDTYASKSELTSAEARLQAAIDAIDVPSLAEYAKTADVDAALALKADKSELTDLVTSEDLANLRTALETEIAKKQNSGDYATAEALQTISTELGTLKGDVYTKAQVDAKIAEVAAGGEINLDGYATTSALDALTALVNGNTNEITALKNAGYQTSAQVQSAIEGATASLATTEALNNLQTTLQAAIDEKQAAGDYASTEALKELSDKVTALQEGGVESGEIVALQTQINEITLNYATKNELSQTESDLMAEIAKLDLADYAKTADLANVAFSGDYDDLLNKPDLTQYVTTTQVENSVNNAMNSYDIPDNSITAAKIQQGAVTSDKINTEAAAGEMVMLMSNGDGTSSWVSVSVDAE